MHQDSSIYFATTNTNKLKEAISILGIQVNQIDIETIEPQGLDLEQIAVLKARDAYSQIKKPIIIEDSGLEFSAWGGLPGPLIKWFVESVGNKGIIKMLDGFIDRKAIAKTVVAYVDEKGVKTFIGELHGSISLVPTGENGFGWDAIFIPDGLTKTIGEMSEIEKNKISMRKIAFNKMKEAIL